MSEFPAPFVVGVSRSGTTLLRLMLDSHPDLAIPFETHFVHKLATLGDEPVSRERFLVIATASASWPNLGLDAAALSQALDAVEPFSVTAGLRSFYQLSARRAGKAR